MARFSLEMAVTIADVRRLNEWFDEWLAKAGIDPAVGENMKLCLNEAVANVVEHGFDQPNQGHMSIDLEELPQGLRCTLTDNGRAFDPTTAAEAKPMTDLETSQVGGYGISLMRANSDALSYRRVGDENLLVIDCLTPVQAVPR